MKLTAFFFRKYGPLVATWESLGVTPASRITPGQNPRELAYQEHRRLKIEMDRLVESGVIPKPASGYLLALPDGYIFQRAA